MRYFWHNNHSSDLIIFFTGWGCDENQFTNLQDKQDVLILYDYQDLSLDFDFNPYRHINVLAYSAGVFIASIMQKRLPRVQQKVAICGTPYLFDETLGLSAATVKVFNNITLDNYLEFRRQYMVQTDEEYARYNELQSLRTLESCQSELESLQQLYHKHFTDINPIFDKAVAAENDIIFPLNRQKAFYHDKLRIIPQAKHHIFFRFNSFEDILNIK
jgi:biotin synthesis protein BioG